MSRLQPVKKTCLQCNKTFFAKRSDAKYCTNVCRAVASTIAAEGPAIIAAARKEFIEEFKNHDTCEWCNNYKVVTACFSEYFPFPFKLCSKCNSMEVLSNIGIMRAKLFIEADKIRISNGGKSFADMIKSTGVKLRK